MTFIGPVDTRGRLDVDVRGQVADWLRHYAGKVVAIEVLEHKAKRSGSQNRRYWSLLHVAAESLWGDPSDADTLHEEVAHLLLALPPCEKTGLRRRMRTPTLNTAEFSRYMDLVADKLVELGADLTMWDAMYARMSEGQS